MANLEQRPVHSEHLDNTNTPEHEVGSFEHTPQENVQSSGAQIPTEAGNVAVDIASMGLETGNKNPDARGKLELPDAQKAAALESLLNDGELSITDSSGAHDLMEQVNGIMSEHR